MSTFPVSDTSDILLQDRVRSYIDCPDFILMTDQNRKSYVFDIPDGFWGDATDIFDAIIHVQNLVNEFD